MNLSDMFPQFDDRGAEFSDCKKYRYLLWRIWNKKLPTLTVIGLNPSTADETIDDPTVRKCMGYARAWNYGGLYMTNLFAFRSTDPKGMLRESKPIGPRNDTAIRRACDKSIRVLAAWGVHGSYLARDEEVIQAITPEHDLYCLAVTKEGYPKHPLYIKKKTKPILYDLKREIA